MSGQTMTEYPKARHNRVLQHVWMTGLGESYTDVFTNKANGVWSNIPKPLPKRRLRFRARQTYRLLPYPRVNAIQIRKLNDYPVYSITALGRISAVWCDELNFGQAPTDIERKSIENTVRTIGSDTETR